MAREVTWAESASDDHAEVASYIARDSKFYATAVVRELILAVRSLDVFAQRGRVVPEYRDPSIRELLVRDYRLVCQVGDVAVHVLRIIHGARPLPVDSPQFSVTLDPAVELCSNRQRR